jgi:hypothetical protein
MQVRGSLGEYNRICGGDLAAGNLLYHIAYLCAQYADKLVVVGGKKFWVHTREQTMYEVCLKKTRYDLALKYLKDEGLIEVTHTAWGRALHVTALRVTEKTLELVEEAVAYRRGRKKNLRREADFTVVDDDPIDEQSEPEPSPSVVPEIEPAEPYCPQTSACPDGHPIARLTGQYSIIKLKEKTQISAASAGAGPSQGIFVKKHQEEGSSYKTIGAENRTCRSSPEITAHQVRQAYGKGRRVLEPTYMLPIWSHKDLGQANQFVKHIRRTRDGYKIDVLDVVTKCVSHWPAFQAFVLQEERKKVGDKPTIASLLYCAGLAVDFAQRELTKPKKDYSDFGAKLPNF